MLAGGWLSERQFQDVGEGGAETSKGRRGIYVGGGEIHFSGYV